MLNKGFTLVELLAVIIILGVIALITIPIVSNVVDKAERDAEAASVKQYINAVEDYLLSANTDENTMIKDGVCTINSNSTVSCGTKSFIVETKNAKVTSGTLVIKDYNVVSPSTIVFENNKYSVDSNGNISAFVPVCELATGTSKAVGAKYTCHLDQDRTFYVLGNNESDNSKIDLIMDRNFTDTTVPSKMKWCVSGSDNSCNHDNLDPYIEHIQKVFGDIVIVSLPSKEQITNANGGSSSSLPIWLYDYLNGTTHSVSGLRGYWTSTPRSESAAHAFFVFDTSNVDYLNVSVPTHAGIRPVITIPKLFVE